MRKQEGIINKSTLEGQYHHFLIPNSLFLHPRMTTKERQVTNWSLTKEERELVLLVVGHQDRETKHIQCWVKVVTV